MQQLKPLSKLQGILFLDIETVPQERIIEYDSKLLQLFAKRNKEKISSEINPDPQVVYDRSAGLYAEFGKVFCVSMGRIDGDVFKMKSICYRDEKKLLEELAHPLSKTVQICGHNIKNFDMPFLFRRYVINGLPIPECLNVMGKKPWEVAHLDTMELWGHLQFKYTVSADLLAHCLGLPSPKVDIDGSQIGELYHSMFDDKEKLPFDAEQEVIAKVSKYCEGDVLTAAQIFCRLTGIEEIKNVTVV